MDIATQIVGDILIVKLIGELDMHSVPGFRDKIIKEMDNNLLKHLVLNLKEVRFIDSSGLGAILGRYRYLNKKGGRVLLVGLKPQIAKIFKMAGILKIMKVYDSEKLAVQELDEGGLKNA
ncbi:anti-sigma F factor antagonist [Halocella sp. SP3-1]|uniref:anti-sigma F factor antagonist n=1 Tax=Halocella sp. SP3-1 TaxID=2382161 RepID=UPI000F74EED6|nr:anti-sigma F factor antagonist [Halocella sp. SP3-1]AZO95616.1 anti-sigma F factor antagonist [Halocella sp. SP3-1]